MTAAMDASTAHAPAAAPVLQLSGIHKQFAGITVLRDVQLNLYPGEIHALMGQNGAGKSTLIKVLTGVLEASGGQMRLGGQAVWPDSPLAAQRLGISTVYQEVNLCPNLSVAENIFAGRYPRCGIAQGFRIDWATLHQRARDLVARIGLQIDVTRLLSDYPVAVQQLVAIARALSIESRVLILDEPTSSLDDDEVQKLFEVLRRLRSEGLSIVFVTHFLNQVYAVSDRITVLRNGSWVGEWLAKDLGPQALIAAMLGRDLAAASEQPAPAPTVDSRQATLLQTEGLGQDTQLQPLDLQIRAGEVVGLAGLLGSGRTELARLLFGLEQPDRGALRIDGQVVKFANPMDAIRHGLALCPEERKTDGIVAELSVRENIALALQARLQQHLLLNVDQRGLGAENLRPCRFKRQLAAATRPKHNLRRQFQAARASVVVTKASNGLIVLPPAASRHKVQHRPQVRHRNRGIFIRGAQHGLILIQQVRRLVGRGQRIRERFGLRQCGNHRKTCYKPQHF